MPVVHFNFGYWDWHGENFVAGRQQIPMFDNAMSALLEDLPDDPPQLIMGSHGATIAAARAGLGVTLVARDGVAAPGAAAGDPPLVESLVTIA